MSRDNFDPADLLARFDGDREFMVQLAEIFLADAPVTVLETRRMLDANDAAGLARTAHSLKGSLGCFGADAAWATADALETMGRAGDLTGAGGAFAELTQQVEALTTMLRQVCDEPQG